MQLAAERCRGGAAEIAYLERLLDETEERNRDNVTRTESYLELYAFTRGRPPDLPWLLMAHLVSRNAGHMMSDVARSLEQAHNPFAPRALEQLFAFLERANFLIFHDAWHHVIHHLLGRSHAVAETRASRFVRDAWRTYEEATDPPAAHVDAATERRLALDLVVNEQNYIERRVVHHPRFEAARAIVAFIEAAGHDEPLVLPASTEPIRIRRFASLERRIEAGRRIFDAAMRDRARRDEAYAWAMRHPHTGSREAYGGRAGPTVREAWPVDRVRALWAGIHAPPEPDPAWC